MSDMVLAWRTKQAHACFARHPVERPDAGVGPPDAEPTHPKPLAGFE